MIAALVVVIELVLHLALPVEPDIGTNLILNNKLPGVSEKVNLVIGPDLLRRANWGNGENTGDSIRVVCLGGAATVGMLQNVRGTWWGRLQESIKGLYPDKKIEFAALGVEARGSRFGAKWASESLSELKPDLVIAQYGLDDVLYHPESYEFDERGLDAVKLRRQRRGVKKVLINMSQIVRRISRVRQETAQKLQQKRFGQENYYASVMERGRILYREMDLVFALPREEGKDPMAEYLQSLRVIVGASRDAGAKVLLVGEPTLCGEFMDASARQLLSIPVQVNDAENPLRKPEPGWVEKELYRYYANANEYAKEAAVPFVNLEGEVPKDRNHFLNESMLTDKGAQIVADLLLPQVKLLLP